LGAVTWRHVSRSAPTTLAELDVGAIPIGGEDDRLKGMLTERDIVVKVQGSTPSPCEH
jgi:CBS domain-containing protein